MGGGYIIRSGVLSEGPREEERARRSSTSRICAEPLPATISNSAYLPCIRHVFDGDEIVGRSAERKRKEAPPGRIGEASELSAEFEGGGFELRP